MYSVSLFVKAVVSITFLWCIAELVMPVTGMKKYSSFIYGLIIVSLTVSVFVNLDYENLFSVSTQNDVSKYNKEYLKSLYEERLERVLIEKFGDDSIDVELTDDYMLNKISCDDEEIYDNIMRYINE